MVWVVAEATWVLGVALVVRLLCVRAARGDRALGLKGDARHLAPAEVDAMRQSARKP